MHPAEPPYFTYSRYLRERHGCTVYRVAVDAGFGCPHRSGGRSGSGCTFCGEEGARAPYQEACVQQSRGGLGARPFSRDERSLEESSAFGALRFVTPGLDPGAQAETIVACRASHPGCADRRGAYLQYIM